MIKIRILLLIVTSPVFCLAQNWVNVGNGLNWNVYDLISHDGKLYAAGRLGASWREVHSWDGENWQNTNSIWGIFCPLTLEVYQDELYTSGDATDNGGQPTKVFKWKSGNWEQQGVLFQGDQYWNSVKKLKAYDGYLFAAGHFPSVGNVNCSNIAKWDGNEWSNVGEGVPDLVIGMDVFQDKLIVCHQKDTMIIIDDTTTIYTARRRLSSWDGTQWYELDTLFKFKNVDLIRVIDSELFFSSNDTINGVAINGLGKWDGNSITSIGDTLFKYIEDVAAFNNKLYVACQLKTANPNATSNVIRKYENGNWITAGEEFNQAVLKLSAHQNSLYACGFFNQYDNLPLKYIAVLDDAAHQSEAKEDLGLRILPNPTNNELFVSIENEKIKTISLCNAEGKLIYLKKEINSDACKIGLKNYPSGIYSVIILTQSGKIVFRKILKTDG